MSEASNVETRGFEAEVKQILNLRINSLYSNKEIFLRELVSNASDAADKLRFEALTEDSLYAGDGDLGIEIEVDSETRTLTVRDNGIGMSYDEVIENLGTIAHSGTRQFLESLTGDEAEDARLIGQFGVGFYSSFIVADKVTLTTRRAGLADGDGVRWESLGDGEYTIETAPAPRRGTEVVLHLREGEDEFLEAFRLRNIVRKYSDHITIPIRMQAMSPPAGEEDDDAADEPSALEQINSATALWARNRNEIKDEEYDEFYKHVAHDFEAPLARSHNRVEGNLEYTALLFIPGRAPFDLWDRSVRKGVRLYVRRIFIMDDAETLMPAYLRFVKGVVDCADLPLNVSRELLQQNKQIDSIRAGSVKRVLDLLSGLAKNEGEKYATFWGQFGRVLKEGVIEDQKNSEAIAKLFRFASTQSESDAQTVSLEEYAGRMKEGQEKIYFITADNYATASNSPHLELFKDRGIEVLLLTDEIDEWVVHHLTEFDGKQLQSVAKGAVDLDAVESSDDEDADSEEQQDEPIEEPSIDELIKVLEQCLAEKVKTVRTTSRLTSSPACLVADDHEMGAHLERILRSAGQEVPGSKPILEVNPKHPIVTRLTEEEDADAKAEWANILFDQAVLSEGGRVSDPASYVKRVNDMFLNLASGRP